MDWTKFWWQNVGNARAMADAVEAAVLSGKSVLLPHFERLPWRDAFRETVWESLHAQAVEKSVVQVETAEVDHPDQYLLSLLRDHSGFRPNTQKPSDYIKARGELRDRVFWLKNISQTSGESWCALIRELAGAVQFVAELEEADRQVKGAERLAFGELVRDYDYLFFALAVAFSRRDCGGTRTCRYIAEVARTQFQHDAEGICHLALTLAPEADPISQGLSSDLVWKAQIRTAYHILEEERRKFVARHSAEIALCLPQQQFGETICDPENVEYALLWYLSRPSCPPPHLTLPEEEDELLRFLRSARNFLSHGRALSPTDLTRLFSL